MVKKDYLMRLISEMVRAVLKMLFNIDTDSPSSDLLEDAEQKETLDKLLEMANQGEINEAENCIYEMTSDGNFDNLKIALIFYSYLNEKSDVFLEAHDFSRDEIEFGMKEMVSKYGLDRIGELFLKER